MPEYLRPAGTVLWALANNFLPNPLIYFSLRSVLVQYRHRCVCNHERGTDARCAPASSRASAWRTGQDVSTAQKGNELLIILALIKRLPYRWFAKSHIALAVLYLMLIIHRVGLFRFAYWVEPIGIITVLFVGWWHRRTFQALFKRIGLHRKVQGEIQTLVQYPEMNLLEIHIALRGSWPGHKAGQFAFVTSSESEEGTLIP